MIKKMTVENNDVFNNDLDVILFLFRIKWKKVKKIKSKILLIKFKKF